MMLKSPLSDAIVKLRLTTPGLDVFQAAEVIYNQQEKKIEDLQKKLDATVNSDNLSSTGGE